MSELEDTQDPTRRDFITGAAWTFVAVGGAAASWPFIDQMNPNKGTPPPEVVEVDLQAIQPGQTKAVRWRGKPIFIRHRTPGEVEAARAAPLGELRDPLARNWALPDKSPATDANRTKPGHEQWLVVVGLCTHLNCLLSASVTAAPGEGWFCACHAARYDLSGRVRGGPAPTNLPVPPYEFLSANRLRIG